MSTTGSMVLRSVHLPRGMDDDLREMAFHMRVSKADLIRSFVQVGLDEVKAKVERLGSERDLQHLYQELHRRFNPVEPGGERGVLDATRRVSSY